MENRSKTEEEPMIDRAINRFLKGIRAQIKAIRIILQLVKFKVIHFELINEFLLSYSSYHQQMLKTVAIL